MADGQGKAGSHRCIHSVAALLEDLATDGRRNGIDRYDKTVFVGIR